MIKITFTDGKQVKVSNDLSLTIGKKSIKSIYLQPGMTIGKMKILTVQKYKDGEPDTIIKKGVLHAILAKQNINKT